jgi:cell division protein FtsW
LAYVAGAPVAKLAVPAAFTGFVAVVFVAFKPYALRRMTGFLHPWKNADDEGFQLVQSFVAFGRGGSTGVGFGDGRQKLGYLPEAHTDFILAALGEELGLVGVLIVLGSFAALTIAGLRIAGRARDPFARLVAFGMTTAIVVPATVNAAVVMGVLPTTGFTLPFVSYGRVSLVTCGLAVGILLRIGAFEAAPVSEKVAGAARRRMARA